MNKRSLLNELKEGAKLAGKIAAVGVVLVGLAIAGNNAAKRISGKSALEKVKKLAEASMIKYDVLGQTGCSATVVGPNLAITAAHCIPQPMQVMMLIMGGLFDPLRTPVLAYNNKPLRVIFHNAYQDQAVLMGDFSDKVRVLVDDYEGRLYTEKRVVVCGFPGDNRKLRCRSEESLKRNLFMQQHEGMRIPGESGGAIFAEDGTLIGIIYGVNEEGHSLSNTTTGLLSMASRAYRQQK